MKKILISVVLVIVISAGYYLFVSRNANQDSGKVEKQVLPVISQNQTFSLAEVAKHNSESRCFAAINNGVYDLTNWIIEHPGGEDKILNICGTDATKVFSNRHAGQEKPNQALANLKIGTPQTV